MKSYILYIAILSGMIMTSASCSKKVSSSVDQIKVEEPVTPSSESDASPSDLPIKEGDDTVAHSTEEDCHGVRKSIRKITNQEAEILKIGNRYLISVPPGTRRFNPCEIPADLQKEGQKVLFSGVVLEIFPGERLMGSPFRLTAIEAVD